MNAVTPQLGVLIMDDGKAFGDEAAAVIPPIRPTSVRLAIEGAPQRPGLRTVAVVPPEQFTLRTAITKAAAEGLFWIAAPRNVQDPLTAFIDAARGAAGILDREHPGFAVTFTEPGRPFDRIAVVADLRDPVTTGMAAWAAVGIATRFGTQLDVLALGAAEGEVPADWREAMQLFSIRGDSEELVRDALERADEHGLRMRWVPMGSPMDKPAAILRAVVQGGYDVVVDDLPAINVGPRVGRRRRVQAALSQAGSNATAYRLVRDAPCSVVVVLDAARMGLVSQDVARAGAVALALGVVGAGSVAASGSAAADANATMEPTSVSATTEAVGEAAAAAAVAPAELDYSTMTEADLAALNQQRSEAVAARDQLAAELAAQQGSHAQLTADLASVQAQQEAMEPELAAASADAEEAERVALYTRIMRTGPLAWLPGVPTAAEAQAAQEHSEAATAHSAELETSYEGLEAREQELVEALQATEAQVGRTQASLSVAEQNAATLGKQSAELKWTLNPVVVPTAPGYSITTYYGVSGGYWSSGYHTGLDFAQPTGADVYAAKDGVVVEAGWGGAYGNTVVIQHADGMQTRYAHMSRNSVSVGQTVTAGQHIGDVGSTGNTTGPHLHFEVMDANGNFVDPAAWLGL